jgi:hypothetical protein
MDLTGQAERAWNRLPCPQGRKIPEVKGEMKMKIILAVWEARARLRLEGYMRKRGDQYVKSIGFNLRMC